MDEVESNSSSIASISSGLSLPFDIWPEVATYISPYNASKLSLTCLAIRELVQPFAFQRIIFHPFCTKEVERNEDLGRTLEKLTFLQSPRIVRRVEEISICPRRRRGDGFLNDNTLRTILSALSSFPNLRRLFMKHVRLPVSEEQQTWPPFPLLQVLSMEGCTHHGGTIRSAGVNVQTLICDRNIHPSSNFLQSFVPLMLTKSLRSLVVGTFASLNLPVLLVLVDGPFRKLVELDVCESIVLGGESRTAFSLLKNLKTLRLRHSPTRYPMFAEITPLPPSCLPSLTSYEGAYTLAPIFSLGSSVRKYILWPAEGQTLHYNQTDLCEFLHTLDPETSILEFGSIIHIGEEFLSVILQKFSQLKHLAINAHSSFAPPTIDMPSLISAIYEIRLPATLEHLSLGVHWDHSSDTQRTLVDMVSAFTTTCPKAQTIELWHNPYDGRNCFVWKRPENSPVDAILMPTPGALFPISRNDHCDYHKRAGEFRDF